ncbi:MAG: methyltransferase domain-containing protein [Gammaproteobacteria bacterium]
MKTPHFTLAAELADDDASKPYQDTITRTSKISAHFSVYWASDYATHIDSKFIDNINIWRDFFPPEIDMQLEGTSAGTRLVHSFGAGEVLPGFTTAAVHRVRSQQFNRHFTSRIRLEPRLGRFYPQGIFENIPGNNRSNYQPCRITGLDDDSITTDFNHPLATKALNVETDIIQIWDGGQEHGGRCNDIVEQLTHNGPGMQARYNDYATDFWSDDAFSRQDETPDDAFYARPRLVDHLDRSCSLQIGELYRQLLPHDGHILDLMSSWVSHFPEELSRARITGLGMNQHELEQNPMLSATRVHDLNQQPCLPFDDATFDGIACTASIEYLTSPRQVFSELVRILKTGAPLVITFSNRWFPPKAIKAWGTAHEFERIGMVLEHFIEDGSLEKLHSYSLRGLPRPHNDKYADQLTLSDPVYAVWGHKR